MVTETSRQHEWMSHGISCRERPRMHCNTAPGATLRQSWVTLSAVRNTAGALLLPRVWLRGWIATALQTGAAEEPCALFVSGAGPKKAKRTPERLSTTRKQKRATPTVCRHVACGWSPLARPEQCRMQGMPCRISISMAFFCQRKHLLSKVLTHQSDNTFFILIACNT